MRAAYAIECSCSSANPPPLCAQLYSSTAGAFSKIGSMNAARVGHSSTLLQSGKVLNAAHSDAGNELNSAETYQPQ